MLVHYYYLDRRLPADTARLFDPIGTPRLPVVNWAGVGALFSGIFATWLFMYGLLPATQGPIAVAMGGLDLSWLAGGLTSAAVYAAFGPRIHRRFLVDNALTAATKTAGTDKTGAAGTAEAPARSTSAPTSL
jgi:toxin CptA